MFTNTSKPSRFFVVIPCAGSGNRARTSVPKQYQTVVGKPLVWHTLQAFAGVTRMARGVLVLAADDAHMQLLLTAYPQPLFTPVYTGGATRAASVLAGLHALVEQGADDTDWVVVHDAARCLVTPAQIDALLDACQADAVGGLLAHKLADTLKCEHQGRVSHTVDRSDKWLAQTPQMFRLGLLMRALQYAGEAVTDEASAIEALNFSPLLVASDAQNFKVTYPQDFALAEAILESRSKGTL